MVRKITTKVKNLAKSNNISMEKLQKLIDLSEEVKTNKLNKVAGAYTMMFNTENELVGLSIKNTLEERTSSIESFNVTENCPRCAKGCKYCGYVGEISVRYTYKEPQRNYNRPYRRG